MGSSPAKPFVKFLQNFCALDVRRAKTIAARGLQGTRRGRSGADACGFNAELGCAQNRELQLHAMNNSAPLLLVPPSASGAAQEWANSGIAAVVDGVMHGITDGYIYALR